MGAIGPFALLISYCGTYPRLQKGEYTDPSLMIRLTVNRVTYSREPSNYISQPDKGVRVSYGCDKSLRQGKVKVSP